MELLIDTSRKSFTVGRPFDRKVDDNGVQRLDRKTGAPQWSAQLVVMDERGADTIIVTIAGDPPQLQQGQPVTPVALVAIPWNRTGREGIAYRAFDWLASWDIPTIGMVVSLLHRARHAGIGDGS